MEIFIYQQPGASKLGCGGNCIAVVGLISWLSILQLLFWSMFSNLFQFCQFSTPVYHPRYVSVKSPWSESYAHMIAQSSHLCLYSQFVFVSGMLVPQKFMQTVAGAVLELRAKPGLVYSPALIASHTCLLPTVVFCLWIL